MQTRYLLSIPAAVYILSYIYMAVYHGRWDLWSTVVHEGGTLTLLGDMFYASHFLGHIPVHLVLALFFVGIYLSLSRARSSGGILKLTVWLFFFLAVSWFISIRFFSLEDTLAYVLQQKQGVTRMEQGGSWNLHLPSTMMQFLLIPIFIVSARKILGYALKWNGSGRWYIALAAAGFAAMTQILNGNMIAAIAFVWTDPRYLAHSVRELMTFPLTYYPIPLYFFLRSEAAGSEDPLPRWLIVIAVLFLAGLAYQAYVPLSEGIGELAQKPAFAKGGKLSVLYLLSAHYFEHFLDTIFFALVCLILFRLAPRQEAS